MPTVSAALKIPEPFDAAVTSWRHYHIEITQLPQKLQMDVNYKTSAWIIAKKLEVVHVPNYRRMFK